jgi:hypothetical protein
LHGFSFRRRINEWAVLFTLFLVHINPLPVRLRLRVGSDHPHACGENDLAVERERAQIFAGLVNDVSQKDVLHMFWFVVLEIRA